MATQLHGGFRKGVFYAPSIGVDSLPDGGIFNTGTSRPFGNGHGFTKCSKTPVVSSIVALFARRGPLAIILGISLLIVFPIELHSIRNVSHIPIKIIKNQPFVGYGNSSSSVTVVSMSRRVETSSLHHEPNIVNFCPRFSMSSYKEIHDMNYELFRINQEKVRVS